MFKAEIVEGDVKSIEDKIKKIDKDLDILTSQIPRAAEVFKTEAERDQQISNINNSKTRKVIGSCDKDGLFILISDMITSKVPLSITEKINEMKRTKATAQNPKELRDASGNILSSIFEQDIGQKVNITDEKFFEDILTKYSIYNTDLMLKIMALLADKEMFSELYNNIFSTNTRSLQELVNIFFMDVGDIPKVKSYLEKHDRDFEKKIDRDSKIYQAYFTANNRVILLPTLLRIISKKSETAGYNPLFANVDISGEMTMILAKLIQSFKDLLEQYKGLLKQYQSISMIYSKFVDKHKRIFGFIKERCDTVSRNPRFTINANEEGYLLMKYFNIDGKFPADKKYFIKDDGQNFNDRYGQLEKATKNDGKIERYYMGQFDGIYLKTDSNFLDSNMKPDNKKVATDVSKKVLPKLLEEEQDLCMIGYGQSGSGKTSTLIYYDDGKEQKDGILMELCNLEKFTNVFKKIKLLIKDVYILHGTGAKTTDQITNEQYVVKDINETSEFVFKNGSWINSEDIDKTDPKEIRRMSSTINNAFDKREVEPTPNNPDSSRSHVLVCLLLYKEPPPIQEEFGVEAKVEEPELKDLRKIVICDFAGVENVFQCQDPSELFRFNKRYGESKKYKKNNIVYDRYYCDQDSKIALNQKDEERIRRSYNENLFKIHQFDKFVTDALGKIRQYDQKELPDFPKSSKDYPKELQYANPAKCYDKEEFPVSCAQNVLDEDPTNETLTEDLAKIEEMKTNKEILKYLETKITEKNGELDTIFNHKDFKAINLIAHSKKPKAKTLDFTEPKTRTPYKLVADFLDRNDKTIFDRPVFSAVKVAKYNFKAKRRPSDINEAREVDITTLTDDVEIPQPKTGNKTVIFQIVKIMFNNILEELKPILREIIRYICMYERYSKIEFNCDLRLQEGRMINKSLAVIRNDIKKLFLRTLKGTDPIYYNKQVFPLCLNVNTDQDYFSKFYNIPEDSKVDGVLAGIMGNDFQINLSNMNYVIFTVINTTDNYITNNGPNPPYINVSQLIRYRFIKPRKSKLRQEIQKVLLQIEKYDFYRGKINVGDVETLQDSLIDGAADTIIKEIQTNNASTLIGSIEATEVLQNVVYDKVVCSYDMELIQEEDNEKYEKFKFPKLPSYVTGDEMIYDMEAFNKKYLASPVSVSSE
jgi:Kinesin motor domain